MLLAPTIRFAHLGIEIDKLSKSISIFGFDIAFYGIIIAIGMLLGMIIVFHEAKITGQNVDNYYDFAIFLIIFSVIGARLYYVIFDWDQYKDDLLSIFNTRNGGLAIYGGVIAGAITCLVFTRIKKMSFFKVLDTTVLGLLVGQIIGRWGNFVNREAFGEYTNNIFAMQIKLDDVGGIISNSVRNNMKIIDGVKYIQVHPTFLYESLWNLVILIIILIYRKHKKFEGEVLCIYMIGYGIGRFIIEGLRTDQLLVHGINIPVSQIVSVIIALAGVVLIFYNRTRKYRSEVNS